MVRIKGRYSMGVYNCLYFSDPIRKWHLSIRNIIIEIIFSLDNGFLILVILWYISVLIRFNFLPNLIKSANLMSCCSSKKIVYFLSKEKIKFFDPFYAISCDQKL